MPQQLNPNGNELLTMKPACQGDGYLPGKMCEASQDIAYIDAQHRLRKVCIDCYLRKTDWQGCQAEIAVPVFDMRGCMVDRKVLGFCPAPAQNTYASKRVSEKYLCGCHYVLLQMLNTDEEPEEETA